MGTVDSTLSAAAASNPAASAQTLQLQDVVRVLRRRWKLISLIVVVFLAGAAVLTAVQSPVYEATSTLLIKPTGADDVFTPQQDPYGAAQRRVATESDVVKSSPVRALVKKRIGSAPAVTVTPSSDADVVSIKARSTDAVRARQVANAYAQAYVDTKRRQGIDSLLAASAQIRDRVNALQAQINALDTQVQNAAPSQRDEVGQSVSQRRISLLDQQTGFRETLDQLQVRIALTSGGASVVTPAARPNTPVEPRPLRTGGLGLALGLVVGIGLAFLFENLDDRVRTKADFERATNDLPVLGLIPSFERDQLPITLAQPRSAAAEAYRTLRTSVQFLSIDSPKRLIQVTSPNPSEGKTTTTANLGLALAYAGVRVCIVDCDLRRPCLADAFRVDPAIGFTSVLLGTTSLESALGVSESWGPHLTILPAGPVPPNPSELLSSPRVHKLFEVLAQMFDVVLLDTPPALPVSDALVASRLADAVLLVGSAGSTTRKEVQHALELLHNVGAPVVGTVLNGLGPGDKSQPGYGYGYGYGTADRRGREIGVPEPATGEPRTNRRKRRRAHAKRDEVGASR